MDKVKILVVEGSKITASLIQKSFERIGYTASALVTSGEEAIKKAEEDKPDLVLMDILLEGKMDGIEATEIIQSRLNIPIVYLTSHVEKKTLERAKISAPFGFIVKPFEDIEIETNIEMAFYKHRVESEHRQLEKELQQEIKQMEREKAMQTKAALLSAEVDSAITGSNTLRSLLQLCAEAIVRNLNTSFARIWTVNWDKNMLELQARAGMYTHIDGDHARIPVGQKKIGLIVKDRKPFD